MISGTGRLAGQEQQHPPGQPTSDTGATPLYDNLGTLHKEITTESQVTQQYFDQGLRLTYAFNHDEAIKSFKQGLKHDSTCAMCYWGIAYALGPNINLPMDTSKVPRPGTRCTRLYGIRSAVTPKEQAYIEAWRSAIRPTRRQAAPALDTAWARAIGAGLPALSR